MRKFGEQYTPEVQSLQTYLDAQLPAPPDYEVLVDYPISISLDQIIPIPMGTFAVVDVSNDSLKYTTPRYMASSGFIDCVGIIGCMRDSQNRASKWLLSHLTSELDPKTSIETLINGMLPISHGCTIELDLMGGNNNSEYFLKELIKEIKKSTHAKIRNNHTFNEDFKDEIVIDLHLGHIFARKNLDPSELDVMKLLISYTAELDDGPCRRDFTRFEKHNSGLIHEESLKSPIQFDWKECIKEAKANFTRFRDRIVAQHRKELGDSNWKLDIY